MAVPFRFTGRTFFHCTGDGVANLSKISVEELLQEDSQKTKPVLGIVFTESNGEFLTDGGIACG
jgi:hypothetical protein